VEDKKGNPLLWVLAGLGIGMLVSLSVYTLLTYYDEKEKDPRRKNVEELIHEAEHLLEMGKKGAYYAKRNRG
jgi:hypothetical protein